MTTEHEASRTLVKSPPELWAECSDAGGLARHLGEFGEITITRLEPETSVAWEGEHASGTVRIEPSGWGTRVTLTARTRPQQVEAVAEVSTAEEAPSLDVSSAEEAPPIEVSSAEEAPSNQEPPAAGSPETQAPETEPIPQEENDATLEKAAEEPDPTVAPDRGALRIRWRRMTASMRGLFRASETAGAAKGEEPPATEPVAAIASSDFAAAEAPDGTSAAIEAPAPGPAVAGHSAPSEGRDAGRVEGGEAGSGTSVDAELILTAALDSLGQAHHRPFSRA